MNQRVFGLGKDLFRLRTATPSLLAVGCRRGRAGFLGRLSNQGFRLGTRRLIRGFLIVDWRGFGAVDADSGRRGVGIYILVLFVAKNTIEKAPMRGGSPIGCARQLEDLDRGARVTGERCDRDKLWNRWEGWWLTEAR